MANTEEKDEEFQFSVGDKVFAYYDGLLYEAKCLKRRVSIEGYLQYYIHYTGFKAKWDEWVDQDEVLVINDINIGHKGRLESNRLELRRSIRSKKLQDSKTAKNESPRTRGRNRKNIAKPAESFVEDKKVPVVEDKAIPIEEYIELPAVEDGPVLEVESEVEDEVAVQAAANSCINIIPRSKLLANELSKFVIPLILKEALDFDRSVHETNKINVTVQFPEENFVAEVLHKFTKSSYFVDTQNKYSILFPVTLMTYFNLSVHTHLIFKREIISQLQNKGMEYFCQRMRDRPTINYVYKNHLNPKKIWCYVYGPIYLLRLIARLPEIVIKYPFDPEYEIDSFVLHIKQLCQFLLANFDTFFSNSDYVSDAEDE